MGLTNNHSIGYLGVCSTADPGIKKGKKSDIFVDFDGTLYSSTSTDMNGNITEGYQGGSPAFHKATSQPF